VNGLDNPLSDFQLSFQHIDVLVPRVNKGIQFILVISGELKIETSSRFYHLEEKDLLVINRNQLYQVQGSENNRVMMVTISDAFMDHHYADYRNRRFECYSREIDLGREEMIFSLRNLTPFLRNFGGVGRTFFVRRVKINRFFLTSLASRLINRHFVRLICIKIDSLIYRLIFIINV
jgi:hypothetical protein